MQEYPGQQRPGQQHEHHAHGVEGEDDGVERVDHLLGAVERLLVVGRGVVQEAVPV